MTSFQVVRGGTVSVAEMIEGSRTWDQMLLSEKKGGSSTIGRLSLPKKTRRERFTTRSTRYTAASLEKRKRFWTKSYLVHSMGEIRPPILARHQRSVGFRLEFACRRLQTINRCCGRFGRSKFLLRRHKNNSPFQFYLRSELQPDLGSCLGSVHLCRKISRRQTRFWPPRSPSFYQKGQERRGIEDWSKGISVIFTKIDGKLAGD